MLDTLRRIIQEVNAAPDLNRALGIIVSRVKRAMATDVCSVYLTDYEAKVNVLRATDGLDVDSVGKVQLGIEEGLIGLVTSKAEPVNLHDAACHPAYRYIPETNEQPFHGFLGVPIIQYRKVLGVLVVQKREPHRFDEDAVSSLITLAAQLSGSITHAQVSSDIDDSEHDQSQPLSHFLRGRPGSPGVAFGRAVVVYPPADLGAIPDRRAEDVEEEARRFQQAVDEVIEELGHLQSTMKAAQLPEEDQALFEAYRMMLSSDSLVINALDHIRNGNWAPGALRETIEDHAKVFDDMDDDYMRERASDIRDLGRRILMCLQAQDGKRPQLEYPDNTILVGEELSAMQLAEVPPERLKGLISTHGSGSSHVAILARALGVSAVMGVSDMPVGRMDGREVVVDGYRGRVYISPPAAVREDYLRIAREEEALNEDLKSLTDLPAETSDGHRVDMFLNAGLLADITPSLHAGCDGIGLYRTEYPFMIRDRFPSEEAQYSVYRKILEAFAPQPVALRTLDIGGDKALPYFPVTEDNPFLGWRGIRITLDHPEIFLVQLRAMLRAAEGLDNLNILFPMIGDVGQLDEALALMQQAYHELLEEGFEVPMPKVGAMIEVPSAVYQADALARRVDFLSIGSNDLTQYLLAVDRNNARVAELFDSLHPAVLRALIQVVDGANRHNTKVSVCGEMAGEPASALLLLGMGIDSLSMNVGAVPRIKWLIRSFSRTQAEELLSEALTMEDTHSIRKLVNAALDEAGLGGLIRPGR